VCWTSGAYALALRETRLHRRPGGPIDHHVAGAREIAALHGLSDALTSWIGDARTRELPDAAYDAVLMLGPLYHLIDRADRSRAWSKAWRVVGIPRFASLLDGLKRHELGDSAFAEIVRRDLRTGEHRNPEVSQRPGWFTRLPPSPGRVVPQAFDAGLTDVRLFAVEGPPWMVEDIDDLNAHVASARAVAMGWIGDSTAGQTSPMAAMPDVLEASPLSLVRWSPDAVDGVLEAVRSSFAELQQWMHWAQTMPTREQQRKALAEGNSAFDAGTDFQFLFRESKGDTCVGGGGVSRRSARGLSRSAIGCGAIDTAVATRPGQRKS
jgi:hypothetical protein